MVFDEIFKLSNNLDEITYNNKTYDLRLKEVESNNPNVKKSFNVYIRNKVKNRKKVMCFVCLPVKRYKKPLFSGEKGYIGTINKNFETQQDLIDLIKEVIWDSYLKHKNK